MIPSEVYFVYNNTTFPLDKLTFVSDPVKIGILDTFYVMFCVLVMVIGISGNVFVILLFAFKWKRVKSPEILMLNLALADLAGTIFFPLSQILEILGVNFLPIEEIGCSFMLWAILTSITVSAFLLTAIACDRYVMITKPLRQKLSKKKTTVVATMLWIMASSLGIVYFIDRRSSFFDRGGGQWVCRNYWMSDKEKQRFIISVTIVQVVIPLTVCLVIYILTVKELRAQRACNFHDKCAVAAASRLARNTKATKLITVAIACFYLLVLPYHIFFLSVTINGISRSPEIIHLYKFLTLVVMLNSCVNPIIYSRLYQPYKRALYGAYIFIINRVWNKRKRMDSAAIPMTGSVSLSHIKNRTSSS